MPCFALQGDVDFARVVQNCLFCHGEVAKSGHDALSMSLAIRTLLVSATCVDYAALGLINE